MPPKRLEVAPLPQATRRSSRRAAAEAPTPENIEPQQSKRPAPESVEPQPKRANNRASKKSQELPPPPPPAAPEPNKKAKEPPPKLAPGAQALLAQMHESKYSRHNKIAASAAKAVASASQRVK